mmetsp:Transcript_16305/g.24675  ORF Transcript_16305/g.24675 Transcript_16305/m.24675 type:complete len:138 (+) Transcript_16305:172-585(+)
MGGVWFRDTPFLSTSGSAQTLNPILWRAKFGNNISSKLITFDNPTGTITNSDLEQAAEIVQLDVAAQNYPVAHHFLATGSDNIATVCWSTKGSATHFRASLPTTPEGNDQRYYQYNSSDFYIAGPSNGMTDIQKSHG